MLRKCKNGLVNFVYGNNPWLFRESLKTRNVFYWQNVRSFNVKALISVHVKKDKRHLIAWYVTLFLSLPRYKCNNCALKGWSMCLGRGCLFTWQLAQERNNASSDAKHSNVLTLQHESGFSLLNFLCVYLYGPYIYVYV